MARKLVATLLATALIVLAAGPASVALARGLREIAGDSAEVNVGGRWALEFCWEGAECGQTTMTVQQVAIFIAVDLGERPDGVDAVGIVVGPRFVAQFLSNCRALYQSANATETSMSGTMTCQEGYPFSGTWSALKEAQAQ